MLIPNHPDDERLSALASREPDAIADATLTAHVDSCDRCTELIAELGVLRAALADLPEVTPSRPLRLLPPVEEPPVPAADRLGGWARRFFAPVLASGAALALVGTIGTAAPSFSGMATGGAASGPSLYQEPAATSVASDAVVGAAAPEAAASEAAASAAQFLDASERAASPASEGGGDTAAVDESAAAEEPEEVKTFGLENAGDLDDGDSAPAARLAAEQSPWPLVLVSGVALMIAALLLRWMVSPRAG